MPPSWRGNLALAGKLPARLSSSVAATSRCKICLLYTSDAADERSSVDLGGRRIIKKTTIQKKEKKVEVYAQKKKADTNE